MIDGRNTEQKNSEQKKEYLKEVVRGTAKLVCGGYEDKKTVIERDGDEIWKQYFQELLRDKSVESERRTEQITVHNLEQGTKIQLNEVTEAIKRLKKGKAARHDQITAKMLRNLGEKGLKLIPLLKMPIIYGFFLDLSLQYRL
ncbi:hypothetical protein ILUMI_14390 [Ignelater luminosus]|uniref:Uncharacterized protein n=1 Tax=Ignelater luminosus TaxID=2038154 RepID=A0A8K0CW15_IGNLU|nr:hypothetical protein ILUMI_14390 [Ignelater luminosus]